MPVSPDLISTVTPEVLQEVETWKSRPLEPRYIAVRFDALRVKMRDAKGWTRTRPSSSR